MGVQHKLLGFAVFLVLILSFCHGKNVTVQLTGLVHCTDCIRHEFSSSHAYSGINVFISCKSKEKTTQGNGAVDRSGKFTIMLSVETTKLGSSIDRCFAKLQSTSAAPGCPISTAQTASIQLLSTKKHATQAAINGQPTIIKISPVTCQSAMFWPLPNFTFFQNPPPSPEQPIEYPPPQPQAPSLAAPPTQPPRPPVETFSPPPASALPPTLLSPPPASAFPPTLPPPPPASAFPPTLPPPPPAPSPQPDVNYRNPSPAAEPAFQIPHSPPYTPYNTPSFPPTIPPVGEPIPIPSPASPNPIPPPFSNHPFPNFPPHHSKHFPLPNPPPKPGHFHKQPFSPSPIGTSKPPPNAIPRAPPIPQLPRIPKVPRKFFNPPESKAHPPKPSYPFHS